MNHERLLELVPLAALGALDGEECSAFEALLAASPAARGELEAYRELVGRLGLATAAVQPAPELRDRLLRAALHERLAGEVAFRELVSLPETRVVSLAGLAAAPEAHARVVWHAGRGEAVLVTAGLVPAPAGKAYELWIIAKAAPVPAGVFQVDAQGRVVFRLPAGLELAGVKTFAVTVEPEGGTPAPTGAMVLAGAVS